LKGCDSQRFLSKNRGFVNSKQERGREKDEIGDFGMRISESDLLAADSLLPWTGHTPWASVDNYPFDWEKSQKNIAPLRKMSMIGRISSAHIYITSQLVSLR
jgi:hypothetical protein